MALVLDDLHPIGQCPRKEPEQEGGKSALGNPLCKNPRKKLSGKERNKEYGRAGEGEEEEEGGSPTL